MCDGRHPQPVVRARPGGCCKAIHDTEFGVGDSYHVVGSERDFFTAQGHLAGSGMSQFRAIAAWPRGGVGPIRGAASGDDASLRGGPPPHTAGSIKGGSWGRSCSLSFVSIHHRLDSASTLLTPPTRSYLPLGPIARDSTLQTQAPHSRRRSRLDASCTKQETTRQLSGWYRTTEHSPQTYWWRVRAINCTKYRETAASTSSPFSLQYKLFIGFLCACACCPRTCRHK